MGLNFDRSTISSIFVGVAIAAVVGFSGMVATSTREQVKLNSSVDKRLTLIEQDTVNIKSDLYTMVESENLQLKVLNSLNTNVSLLSNQVDHLKNDSLNLKREAADLRNEMYKLQGKTEILSGVVQVLSNRVNELNSDIKNRLGDRQL